MSPSSAGSLPLFSNGHHNHRLEGSSRLSHPSNAKMLIQVSRTKWSLQYVLLTLMLQVLDHFLDVGGVSRISFSRSKGGGDIGDYVSLEVLFQNIISAFQDMPWHKQGDLAGRQLTFSSSINKELPPVLMPYTDHVLTSSTKPDPWNKCL